MIFIRKTHFCFRVDKFSSLLGCFVDCAHLGIVTFFLLFGEGPKWGLLLDKIQCLCEGDEARGPNFLFSSINHDGYSINFCFQFDKVSTSNKLFVTTFPDNSHDRDQNSVNTFDQNTPTIE